VPRGSLATTTELGSFNQTKRTIGLCAPPHPLARPQVPASKEFSHEQYKKRFS
jgi:hypothetical protein